MSGVHITRAGDGVAYDPPRHTGVDAVRLQGREASAGEAFWVGSSRYRPDGVAEQSVVRAESVYVVLDGELELTADGVANVLAAGDSALLPQGVERSVRNTSGADATLLVIMAEAAAPATQS